MIQSILGWVVMSSSVMNALTVASFMHNVKLEGDITRNSECFRGAQSATKPRMLRWISDNIRKVKDEINAFGIS